MINIQSNVLYRLFYETFYGGLQGVIYPPLEAIKKNFIQMLFKYYFWIVYIVYIINVTMQVIYMLSYCKPERYRFLN